MGREVKGKGGGKSNWKEKQELKWGIRDDWKIKWRKSERKRIEKNKKICGKRRSGDQQRTGGKGRGEAEGWRRWQALAQLL